MVWCRKAEKNITPVSATEAETLGPLMRRHIERKKERERVAMGGEPAKVLIEQYMQCSQFDIETCYYCAGYCIAALQHRTVVLFIIDSAAAFFRWVIH
jgi:hypothetical protein